MRTLDMDPEISLAQILIYPAEGSCCPLYSTKMDTQISQKPSLQSKQECVRARKLRMSCDACSSSKTKCDQSRPVCLRCQKTGLKCNYSVSQRKGKPPAASRDPSDFANGRKAVQGKQPSKPANEKINYSGLDSHHAAVEPTFHLDQDSPMMGMSVPMYEDVMPAPWQDFMPDMSDYTASDLSMTPLNTFDQAFVSMDTSSIIQSAQVKQSDDIFNIEEEIPDVPDIGPQHTPSQAELPIPTDPLSTPASGDIKPPSQRYDCTRLVSSTLDSLNLDFQTCSASTTQNAGSMEPSIASFDQILIINKSAVENAHQLLSCPCSLSQQSNLILSLIIEKILTLYQTVIRTNTSARQLSPSSDACADKFVRDTPITIGAYKMDAEDEQRMRMQLVSNELRKAAALVERYADRYCTLGCQEREDKGVYTALTSLLRRRLKEVVGDIASALRNSRD